MKKDIHFILGFMAGLEIGHILKANHITSSIAKETCKETCSDKFDPKKVIRVPPLNDEFNW